MQKKKTFITTRSNNQAKETGIKTWNREIKKETFYEETDFLLFFLFKKKCIYRNFYTTNQNVQFWTTKVFKIVVEIQRQETENFNREEKSKRAKSMHVRKRRWIKSCMLGEGRILFNGGENIAFIDLSTETGSEIQCTSFRHFSWIQQYRDPKQSKIINQWKRIGS